MRPYVHRLSHRTRFAILQKSPFTIHHSSFIIHHLSFIIHHSSFIIRYLLSPHPHHRARHRAGARLQTVHIQPARHRPGRPRHPVLARRLLPIHQARHLTAPHVVDHQAHVLGHRQRVRDLRRCVEGVGVVLLDDEFDGRRDGYLDLGAILEAPVEVTLFEAETIRSRGEAFDAVAIGLRPGRRASPFDEGVLLPGLRRLGPVLDLEARVIGFGLRLPLEHHRLPIAQAREAGQLHRQ